jgi:hypothetical protein
VQTVAPTSSAASGSQARSAIVGGGSTGSPLVSLVSLVSLGSPIVVPVAAPMLVSPEVSVPPSVAPLVPVVVSVRPAVAPKLLAGVVLSAASQYVSLRVQTSSSTFPKHPGGTTRHRATRRGTGAARRDMPATLAQVRAPVSSSPWFQLTG